MIFNMHSLIKFKIEDRIRKEYKFGNEELAEMKRIVGESPFYNKKTKKELSIIELDSFILFNMYIAAPRAEQSAYFL